jgi:sugar lactone lactonase YvrE
VTAPFGGGGHISAPANHLTPPLRPVPSVVVAEWPEGTFLENLAPSGTHPGSWLVTLPLHNRIDRVDPDGTRVTVVELPTTVTGITTTDLGTFFHTGVMGEAGWRLARLDDSGASAGQPGAGDTVCDVPELVFGNGLTWDGHRLLAVDSVLGHVVAIDPVRRTSSVWLAHELLTKLDPATALPGANGIVVHGGWVYVTSTERALLLRSPVASTSPADELEVVAERLVGDDLDIDRYGRVYVATHILHSVLRLDPDGRREDIAGLDQSVAGSTSVALDPRDPTALYVTSTGGMLNPPEGGVQPARLVRLTLDR